MYTLSDNFCPFQSFIRGKIDCQFRKVHTLRPIYTHNYEGTSTQLLPHYHKSFVFHYWSFCNPIHDHFAVYTHAVCAFQGLTGLQKPTTGSEFEQFTFKMH